MGQEQPFSRRDIERLVINTMRGERTPRNARPRWPRHRGGGGGPVRWLPIKNVSSETLPAHGIARVSSATSSLITVTKPIQEDDAIYIINGASALATNEKGVGTFDRPVVVAYDTGTPSIRQRWGPEDDSWALTTKSSGYIVIGDIDATAKTMLVKETRVGPVLDRVRGLLVGAMLTTDTTWDIDNVTVISGRSPLADASSTTEKLTIQNHDMDWAGDDNVPAFAEYHDNTGDWRFYQLKR